MLDHFVLQNVFICSHALADRPSTLAHWLRFLSGRVDENERKSNGRQRAVDGQPTASGGAHTAKALTQLGSPQVFGPPLRIVVEKESNGSHAKQSLRWAFELSIQPDAEYFI